MDIFFLPALFQAWIKGQRETSNKKEMSIQSTKNRKNVKSRNSSIFNQNIRMENDKNCYEKLFKKEKETKI